MSEIDKIKKEMENLQEKIKLIGAEVKELNEDAAVARAVGDKDLEKQKKKESEDKYRMKVALKSDWYLMNAELMEKQKQV